MIEENSTERLNGKQEQINDNVVVLQKDIEEAMGEDELFRLRVVNKALTRENKHLKVMKVITNIKCNVKFIL